MEYEWSILKYDMLEIAVTGDTSPTWTASRGIGSTLTLSALEKLTKFYVTCLAAYVNTLKRNNKQRHPCVFKITNVESQPNSARLC